jgi:hypothetical protein
VLGPFVETLGVQMGIFEAGLVLQPKSEKPIKANVSKPDQCHYKRSGASSSERVSGQDNRTQVGVDDVVRDRSNTAIEKIADHRKIGNQKQQKEFDPTPASPMIDKKAEKHYGKTFQLKESSRLHRDSMRKPLSLMLPYLRAFGAILQIKGFPVTFRIDGSNIS